MNFLERIIYNMTKKYPQLKSFLKTIYQVFLSIPSIFKRNLFNRKYLLREGYFFGFHDKSPWSIDNKKIASHKIIFNHKDYCQAVFSVGYFNDSINNKFIEVAKTKACNWQQGSMLQWIDENKLIYNDILNGHIISRIHDIKDNSNKTIHFPIGSISNDGKLFITFDFDRLEYGMNGYGYREQSSMKYEENPDITLRTIESSTIIDKISLMELKDEYSDLNDGGFYFFTHSQFSRDDRYFSFFLRCFTKGARLKTYLFVRNVRDKKLYRFPSYEMVSHYSWINDNKIIAYCNTLDFGDAYHIFDLSSKYSIIDRTIYDVDGHPQYSESSNLIVTDTYPDRFRFQELSVFSFDNLKKDIVAKLKTPLKFTNKYRCDLHPRWDREGKRICIDTTVTGKRALCVIQYEEN